MYAQALAQANALARRSKGSVVNEDSSQSVSYSQEYGVSSIAQPQITSYSQPMYLQPVYTQPVYSQQAQQQVVYSQPVQQEVQYGQQSVQQKVMYSQPMQQEVQYVQKQVQQQVVYSQPEVQYMQQQQRVQMQREVPKYAYNVRTVMVPKSVTEDYTVMETSMVAIQIPVAMHCHRWISVPREISMIKKRIIKKMVPKTIEVEESYEVESAVTEIEIYEQPSVQGYTGMPRGDCLQHCPRSIRDCPICPPAAVCAAGRHPCPVHAAALLHSDAAWCLHLCQHDFLRFWRIYWHGVIHRWRIYVPRPAALNFRV